MPIKQFEQYLSACRAGGSYQERCDQRFKRRGHKLSAVVQETAMNDAAPDHVTGQPYVATW